MASKKYEINKPLPDTGPDSPPSQPHRPAESTDVTCEDVGKIVQITLVTLGMLAIATYFVLIKIVNPVKINTKDLSLSSPSNRITASSCDLHLKHRVQDQRPIAKSCWANGRIFTGNLRLGNENSARETE
ncbi:hypothetical protein Bbelb_161730 [Branchiostoma belcheri]|nr:hypothetical protein Bbelb_161730 [Branchiostoma belcheri]